MPHPHNQKLIPAQICCQKYLLQLGYKQHSPHKYKSCKKCHYAPKIAPYPQRKQAFSSSAVKTVEQSCKDQRGKCHSAGNGFAPILIAFFPCPHGSASNQNTLNQNISHKRTGQYPFLWISRQLTQKIFVSRFHPNGNSRKRICQQIDK